MKIFKKDIIKFKVGDLAEDNGGCGYYVAGVVEEVADNAVTLKGHNGWIHQTNLKHIDLIGKDVIANIKGKNFRVRVLEEVK